MASPIITTARTAALSVDQGTEAIQGRPVAGERGRIGRIVAVSMAAGFAAAVLLVVAPFIPAESSAMTGAVLCGFGLGWAILAVLSTRLTDQPQRWAAAPALLMVLGGVVLLAVPSADPVLDWVWPPVGLAVAIWSGVAARRGLRSRGGRLLLVPVIAMLAIASIAGGYETVQVALDAKAYPMPGELIDVGGHSLHLNCTGSGAPTVVLEPGAGGMSSTLGWISPAVARDTRVCVYDRAGRGWSEPTGTRQDAARIATDLHELLQRGQVPGPYILAGHSFGGLYVQAFAARYPDEVAGLVLVDSTARASQPDTVPTRDDGSAEATGRVSALISASARLGVGRLFGRLDASGLPPRFEGEVTARSAGADSVRSTIDEYAAGGASAKEAAALQDFADKPLLVLTAGLGHDAGWSASQDRLASLSTNSAHRVIAEATHAALVGEQKSAAATTRAILDVIAAVRHHAPLAS